jgi:phage shock protein PspC (stress-responsive transcriptional regulator)
MEKKLTRDVQNQMVAGVIAGIAKYLGHDVTLWRLAFVFVTIVTGFAPGIIFYILAWIIMPPEDAVRDVEYVVNE